VPNIPLGHLAERLAEVLRDKPLVVHCQSGARSAIASSLLAAHGITNVVNLQGGFGRWADKGNPVAAGND
jgi:hydroxyacylglutathione hydrolase